MYKGSNLHNVEGQFVEMLGKSLGIVSPLEAKTKLMEV